MGRFTFELSDEDREHLTQRARATGTSTADVLRRSLKPPTVRKLLTVAETAERLSVSKATVYRLCREGKLRSRKVKNSLRVDTHSLEDFMDGRR